MSASALSERRSTFSIRFRLTRKIRLQTIVLTADSDVSSQVDWILSFYPSRNIQGEISLLSSCIQEDFHIRSIALELETRKETPNLDLIREFHCSGVSRTRFGRSLTLKLFNELFCEENPLCPPTMLDEKQPSFQMYNSLSKERQLDLLRQWMSSLGLREDAAGLDWKAWLVRLNLLQISQQQVLFMYVYSLAREILKNSFLDPIAEVEVSGLKSIAVDVDGKKGLVHVGTVSPLPAASFIPYLSYGYFFGSIVTRRSFFKSNTQILFVRKVTDKQTDQWLPTTYIQCFSPQGGLQPNYWTFSALMDAYHEVSIESGAALWTRAVEECRELPVAVMSEGVMELLPEIVKFSPIGYVVHLCIMRDGEERKVGVRIPCRGWKQR